jgi:hypothetical protein
MPASPRGYHYISEYRNCPRKWYLHYVCNLAPRWEAATLALGTAFHAGKAAFYKEESQKCAEAAYTESIQLALDTTQEYPDKLRDELQPKGFSMLGHWIADFGLTDLATLDILAIEEEWVVRLMDIMEVTVRIDAVAKGKQNSELMVLETKTTGFSVQSAIDTVVHTDQATMYTLAVQQHLYAQFQNFVGVQPDIAYYRGNVIDLQRPALVYRNLTDLARFRMGLLGRYFELGQKLDALDKGYPEELLFDRCGEWCAQFKCPYAPICRAKVRKGDEFEGFVPTNHDDGSGQDDWRKTLRETDDGRIRLIIGGSDA